MTDIAETANLEAEQDQEIAKPLTLEEARANREKAAEQKNNAPKEKESEEVEAEAPVVDEAEVEEPETEEEGESESAEDEEVLSQTDEIDIDSLTEEDVYELAKLKGIDIENPKSSKAWAEQRKEIKALKDQLSEAQKEREEALSIAPASDSPFASLRDVESVDLAIKQAEVNAEYWNDQLVLNQETQWDDDAGKDVRVVVHEGKSYPVSEVLQFVKNEKAKVKPLRDRKDEIKKSSELFANEDEKVESIKSDLGLDGDNAERYEAFLKSPKFKLVKSLVPEYGAELLELLGHAARSQGDQVKKLVVKRKQPSSVNGKLNIGKQGRSSSSKGGREAQLNKIVSSGGYSPQEKMNAMRELRILQRTK